MKNLMLTTAIVSLTTMGAVAQTADTPMGGDAAAQGGIVPAFLSSDFTGKSLYTLDNDETRSLQQDRASEDRSVWDRISMRWESSDSFIPERDAWNNIGNIDDIVMTQDGELRGILVDVGGFLGLGARTVMVDISELYFVADETAPEDLSDFFVVASMGQEQLEALPEWDDEHLTAGFEARGYGQDMGLSDGNDDMARSDTAMPSEPATPAADQAAMDGYTEMAEHDRTADTLLGADVYGTQGENIATVDDVVMGDDGTMTHLVMDVGGFLGVASHTIALELGDVDIMWNDQDGDVRVSVPMTQAQLESVPEYEG
ncbi:PRC-barrel domain-containing protein [Roseinatronobacter sp. NSM]|uniref:PRC-barrel domain-containing protein n=1 Tax=Roseinatronobacter sp. NSM TaxID=3457785 RepID=UPI004036FE6C